jgi:hypothetical protein
VILIDRRAGKETSAQRFVVTIRIPIQEA